MSIYEQEKKHLLFSFPKNLYPYLSPEDLALSGVATKEEEKMIKRVKEMIKEETWRVMIKDYFSYQQSQKKDVSTQSPSEESTTLNPLDRIKEKLLKRAGEGEEEKKETALKELAFIINTFENYKRKNISEFSLFDQQILALVRLVNQYLDGHGLIVELKTGEGKTSVVIPIFLVWLGLREENIHIHEINPYLLEEGYQNFLAFAQELGIGDQVGKLSLSSPQADKRFLFGYWSDFIHWYQFDFFGEEKEFPPFPKRPVLILDEIDQLLQDESITPAIISEPVSSEVFLNRFLLQWQEELKKEKREPFEFSYETKEGELIEIEIDSTEYDDEISTIPGFINQVMGFFNFFEKYDQAVETSLRKAGKDVNWENKREFWLDNLDNLLLQYLVLSKLPPSQKKLFDESSFREKIEVAINEANFLPWWSDMEFILSLVDAYFMKRGDDYLFDQRNTVVYLPGQKGPIPKIKVKGLVNIKPIAQATGYTEQGKVYQMFLSLFLAIKEQWLRNKEIEPEKVILPEIVSIEVDKINVHEFYQRFNQLFGFTGTAAPIAQRLYMTYGLETTAISPFYPTQRKERLIFTHSFDETVSEVLKLTLNQEDRRNVLIVVDSQEKAERIKNKIVEKGFGEENLEIRILSASNENEDKECYKWISGQEDKKRVLITVKMIGRGVDLQPKEKVKKEGFLMIATTPFLYERAYLQLVGRVGRRGEQGEVVLILSEDDPIFAFLSQKDRELLRKLYQNPSKNGKEIFRLLKKVWQKKEDEITGRLKARRVFNEVGKYLRDWLKESALHLPFLNEEERALEDEFREYIRSCWQDLIWHLEDTFLTWTAVGALGPFGQDDPKGVFSRYFFQTLQTLWSDFLKTRNQNSEKLGKK